MTGTTVSGSYTTGITLTVGTDNPVLVTGTIDVATGQALIGAGGYAWTIANQGTIASAEFSMYSTGAGISLATGGTVSNAASALISGYTAVVIAGAAGTVTNDGIIAVSGGFGTGVVLRKGGFVSNAAGGTINGGGVGIETSGDVTTVINHGAIDAPTALVGISLHKGGLISNSATGVITGTQFGAYFTSGSGTIINAGTIGLIGTDTLGGHVGIGFANGFVGLLVDIPGAVFIGKVNGGNTIGATATSTLELASAATEGTLAGLATQFVNFSQVTIDSAAHWSFASTDTVTAGITLTNSGTISGADVTLAAGATLVNAKDATILRDNNPVGPHAAVFGLAGAGAHYVTNSGVIDDHDGISAGVALFSQGTIINVGSGTISGGYTGIYLAGNANLIVNSGQINGGKNNGLDLKADVAVTNASGGTIIGTQNGVEAETGGGALTLMNDGLIGGGSIGVVIGAGGTVTNLPGGTIVGGTLGLVVEVVGAGASVINQGVIRETAAGDYFGVLLTAPGAVTLTHAGTIETNNAKAVGFRAGYNNRLIVDPGAVFIGSVNGANPVGTAGVQSVLELASGSSVGTVSGIGLQFFNFGSIAFDPGSQWEISGNQSGLAGTISGFAFGDTIELIGVTATGSTFANGVLTITEASGSATLNLPGSFTTTDFVVNNVAGGTDITLACFVAGTRIRTERGPVAVERLGVGTGVVTASGGVRPVTWIGHRTLDLQRHAAAQLASPVLIVAHAFGPGVPVRNLRLSPDHAVFVDGVLIPVKYLINGTTILRQHGVRTVSYFHVELDQHDIVLAEELPLESYLETGGRAMFDNGGAPVLLHPDFAVRAWDAGGCATLIVTGPQLQAVRHRLAAQASLLGRKAG